ncbi:glycosyltransferase [Acidaminococcus timonensis]|uniref:glycosyltransferase n=1 Tax=Acidaminococcus timonensis TaxID=1871002 RepID=UPI0008DAAC91|nr:glycosyltransferase [Acidaminococcus timonensis]
MDKFSALISIYKNENPTFLRESLDSILNNTIQPDEIVMVKDGPLTPELENVLREYQETTGLFHFVIHKKNQGLGIALRDGLLECRNEIVARMDTDDICHPERFQKQLEFLRTHPDIAVIGTNVEEFSSDFHHPDQLVIYPTGSRNIIEFAKKRNPMRHPSVMFRKSAVMASGNYRHFLWFEDYDLCIRMLLHGYKMQNLQEALLYCRADKDLFKRRGGMQYLKQDISFQKFMLSAGFINNIQFALNCTTRSIVRIMPNHMREWFYKIFLRSKV